MKFKLKNAVYIDKWFQEPDIQPGNVQCVSGTPAFYEALDIDGLVPHCSISSA